MLLLRLSESALRLGVFDLRLLQRSRPMRGEAKVLWCLVCIVKRIEPVYRYPGNIVVSVRE
jgi:hypothetical protein